VHVSRIALTDFRSYPAVDLRLGPGVTGFIGPNGHGKTNLVEAVGYAATLGSHRTPTDAPLVRRGAQRAIVRVQIDSAASRTLVELEINPGRANRARLNRTAVRQPRQVIGALRTVLFAPEDLALVKGDPGERRRFLDDLLVTRSPRFAAVRADYDRVVRQRTALLKSAGPRGAVRAARGDPGEPAARNDHGGNAGPGQDGEHGPDAYRGGRQAPAGMLATLDIWDEHLAVAGAELLAGRLDLVARLRPLATAAYARLAGGGAPAGLRYRASFGGDSSDGGGDGHPPDRECLATALREALARSRRAELDRGVCLTGPHRDELELSIGELPARGYASHGESWSLALALRLASYDLLRADGEDPVLLLDDVFAELDPGRRERLAELAVAAEQALVTAAAAADVPGALDGARFTIRDGAVERAK
jgi:DNA replication and repair protein RecF